MPKLKFDDGMNAFLISSENIKKHKPEKKDDAGEDKPVVQFLSLRFSST